MLKDRDIVLTSGDKTWTVMPADVGTDFDVTGAASAAMAVSRESNFFVDLGRRFKLYFSHVDVPLNGTVDSAMLDKVLAEVAQELDVPPVNAGLAIEGGKIKEIEGQQGRVVDQNTLREETQDIAVRPARRRADCSSGGPRTRPSKLKTTGGRSPRSRR